MTSLPRPPIRSATGSPTTHSQAADIYIEPDETQLGVLKTFGPLGSGAGGTTPLHLTGTVSTAAPLDGNVAMTDLLPFGLTWANPSLTATFNVTKGLGGASTPVTGTIQNIANFNSTGRELIRITLPASAFISGYYTITPANGSLIDLTVPAAAATYNNTAQLFVKGIADQTLPTCGPGTGRRRPRLSHRTRWTSTVTAPRPRTTVSGRRR